MKLLSLIQTKLGTENDNCMLKLLNRLSLLLLWLQHDFIVLIVLMTLSIISIPLFIQPHWKWCEDRKTSAIRQQHNQHLTKTYSLFFVLLKSLWGTLTCYKVWNVNVVLMPHIYRHQQMRPSARRLEISILSFTMPLPGKCGLNVVIKYMWQRSAMEAGYLTNFIPNISALSS